MSTSTVSSRRRRESSGRPKMKMKMRRRVQVRKRMTTWSFAEFVKMEESCCVAIPAHHPTISTASTHRFPRYQMGSGYVRAVW